MPSRTPLYAAQAAAGGKMVDFAGWDMAVQFAGIQAEHAAVRTAAGMFDVSHMGRLRVTGPGSTAFLSRLVCRKISDMKAGQVRYGMVLADDGTVEDDILVSREADHQFHVVVNAGNREKILGLWRPETSAAVILQDLSQEQAMIAVQGPRACALLAGLGLDPAPLRIYSFRDVAWRGVTVRVSRTGYTGEDGGELFLPAERAAEMWDALLAAGVKPCGLGCRDTLRLEAAMPLYGHELDRTVTPVEAGLTFAIDPQGSYRGADALRAQLAGGPPRKLVGLRMREKRVPRQGYSVLHGGAKVGVITSGTLSPTLGDAIGLAYVPSALAATGSELAVDVRGQVVPAVVVALPFYKRPR
ncbi:MAG TPA: glycine cleavage system aminomethyltransferase GcvT [Planctomycetes bacterium]|nr:glycine cleavage system aminomethyltransferase GcvT [Planctomycetota bacterium]